MWVSLKRYLWNGFVLGGTPVAFILLAYPLAVTAQHGFNTSIWPHSAVHWGEWYGYVTSFDTSKIFDRYKQVLRREADEFAWGGPLVFALISIPFVIAACGLFKTKKYELVRDFGGVFGAARWANAAELKRMNRGLELGRDKQTGRAIRVSIEENLLTIAPPRKGKTAGLLIPNLLFPVSNAWGGPAVVIDPKGDVFRSVARRRREMGRTVRCLDPANLVGGTDCWNPLQRLEPGNILYLQQTAQSLLPEALGGNDDAGYFRKRAVDLIVGAMLVTFQLKSPALTETFRLLNDADALVGGLEKLQSEPAAQVALGIMKGDPKTKDPIISTAALAFSWLADKRLRELVGSSTFDVADLVKGDVDLFVVIPTGDNETLAPLVRWLLADIFNSIRDPRNSVAERLVIFIDEAAALGRFDAILKASAELPGRGASLWTFWQDRRQIVETYGEAGAAALMSTAAIVTVSDIPATDADESDRWSRALGDFTELFQSKTESGKGEKPAVTTASREARLMTKEELTTELEDDLIVFPNSRYYPRRPLRLKKTKVFSDKRFKRLIDNVKPVGRL